MRRGCLIAKSIEMCLRKIGSCRRFLGFLCCAGLSLLAFGPKSYGDPVFGDVFPLHQPDGTRVDVRVWGDEFYRVVESLDGYTLTRDTKSGAACYARLSSDGNELVSTGVPVGAVLPGGLNLERHIRINPASARAKVATARARFTEGEAEALTQLGGRARQDPPCTGDVAGIVLLVDFEVDEPWSIPASYIDDYCNLVGYGGYGNNGSVRDYFYDVSDGLLTYTNFVPDGYYRAQHPRSYYEDPDIPFGTRARELVIEALSDLESKGFDFSQYDSNGDGLVDAVNCFYAGTRKPLWAQGLWPHSWTVWFEADGVSTYRYQMTDIGDSLKLRTFCHENGHMICYWPDLYDYGYESAGVGQFCLMCYGTSSTNPAEPCAYMKYIAGWSTTTLLTTSQSGLTVPSGINTFYKFDHPTKDHEYYMIENRQQAGRDSGLPDAGLAIWHIDTHGSNDNEQMTPESHYLVTLVQADGDWDLEHFNNYGDSTDLWSAPTHTECTPDTNPNTSWWDGSASTLAVTDISTSAPTMAFTFGLDCNANGVPDDQDISEGTSLDCNSSGVPDECELGANDCNDNGVPDECDIAAGTSDDCNTNVVPDECETDCQPNGIPDDCDIAEGTSVDGDGDVVPDECDNCDLYNPDQLDCHPNGVGDICDIAYGTSDDANGNDIPDECEARRPMAEDCAAIGAGDKCNATGTCTTDADCWEGSHCVPPPTGEAGTGVCYAPKTRFLSIARHPEESGTTACRIKLDDETVLGWVGEPYEVDRLQEPGTIWLADVVDSPIYDQHDGEDGFDFPWPDVVHVTGCEIAHASLCDPSGVHCDPNACPEGETCVHHLYQIQAIAYGFDPGNEFDYSEVLELPTNSTWGDTISTCEGDVCKPPDGVVGIADIMAVIKKYQVIDVAPLVWLDIDPSAGSSTPDQVIGVDDIMNCIDGYQGKPYPGLGPLNCP